MTVYSWNMLFRNKRLDEALAFVRDSGADIFCLQEVPAPFLARLKELPYYLAYASDMERLVPKRPVSTYNVILSNYEIVHDQAIAMPDYQDRLPLRTRLTRWFLKPFHFSQIRDRNGLYADLRVPQGKLRVFNLHLVLAHPGWRLEEFERAMLEHDPARMTMVCGDFNTIESPKVSILNWVFGGRISDMFRYSRERTTIEGRFVAHELVNPLAGSATHPLSRSQLDHILLSREFVVHKTHVVSDRHGSDHHPIYVEVIETSP